MAGHDGYTFGQESIRPSDAVTRAFTDGYADVSTSESGQKITFTATDFITWYLNEVKLIQRQMLEHVYLEAIQ
jgi:hypothetical protein